MSAEARSEEMGMENALEESREKYRKKLLAEAKAATQNAAKEEAARIKAAKEKAAKKQAADQKAAKKMAAEFKAAQEAAAKKTAAKTKEVKGRHESEAHPSLRGNRNDKGGQDSANEHGDGPDAGWDGDGGEDAESSADGYGGASYSDNSAGVGTADTADGQFAGEPDAEQYAPVASYPYPSNRVTLEVGKCFTPGRSFSVLDSPVLPTSTQDARGCKDHCQGLPDAAFFLYHVSAKLCHCPPAVARETRVGADFVGGDVDCKDDLMTRNDRSVPSIEIGHYAWYGVMVLGIGAVVALAASPAIKRRWVFRGSGEEMLALDLGGCDETEEFNVRSFREIIPLRGDATHVGFYNESI